jgi:hypothetical protein
VTRYRLQFDPAALLYQFNTPPSARDQVTRLLKVVQLLGDNIEQAPTVCGERLYGQLWLVYAKNEHHLYEHALEDEVKRLIRSFLGKVARLDEASTACVAGITSQIATARVNEAPGLIADWEASLADGCKQTDGPTTVVVCDREFRLVDGNHVALECVCATSQAGATLPQISEVADLKQKIGLVDWNACEVPNPPSVRYEDSGHQPTARQKAVLEEVVLRSRLITHAGTTYFNPEVGAQPSTLRITERCGEFLFRIFDSGTVVAGVFRTRVADRHSEAGVFRHVEEEFRRQLERRGLV